MDGVERKTGREEIIRSPVKSSVSADIWPRLLASSIANFRRLISVLDWSRCPVTGVIIGRCRQIGPGGAACDIWNLLCTFTNGFFWFFFWGGGGMLSLACLPPEGSPVLVHGML